LQNPISTSFPNMLLEIGSLKRRSQSHECGRPRPQQRFILPPFLFHTEIVRRTPIPNSLSPPFLIGTHEVSQKLSRPVTIPFPPPLPRWHSNRYRSRCLPVPFLYEWRARRMRRRTMPGSFPQLLKASLVRWDIFCPAQTRQPFFFPPFSQGLE